MRKKQSKTKRSKSTQKTAEATNKVVFAFRLTPEERDTIHKAAGPRGASQFVLKAALAAASKVKSASLELAK